MGYISLSLNQKDTIKHVGHCATGGKEKTHATEEMPDEDYHDPALPSIQTLERMLLLIFI